MTNSVSVQKRWGKTEDSDRKTKKHEEEGGEDNHSEAHMVTVVVWGFLWWLWMGRGGGTGSGRGCGCHDTVLVFRLLFLQQLRTMLSACELFSVSISVLVFL